MPRTKLIIKSLMIKAYLIGKTCSKNRPKYFQLTTIKCAILKILDYKTNQLSTSTQNSLMSILKLLLKLWMQMNRTLNSIYLPISYISKIQFNLHSCEIHPIKNSLQTNKIGNLKILLNSKQGMWHTIKILTISQSVKHMVSGKI